MEKLPLKEALAAFWEQLKQERNWRATEDEHLARYIRPQIAGAYLSDGGKNTDRRPIITQLWDDTAVRANDTWARGVNSMTHNQATDWFELKDSNEDVSRDGEALAWYGRVNQDLKKEARQSGLYVALLNRLKDVGAMGYGAIYSYESDNKGHIQFEYVPSPECYFQLDRQGLCRRFVRPMSLTYPMILERGIAIERCSRAVQDAHRAGAIGIQFDFRHYVFKRDEMPKVEGVEHDYAGLYVEASTGDIVQTHGFHDMPYHVLAWDKVPGSPYPASIGYTVLPEIRNLNAQRKKFDRILDLESDSPMLAPSQDEGKEQAAPQPGEMIYGGISGAGQRLYDLLYQGAAGSRTLAAEVQASRNIVLEAFHNNLMLMIANGQMTATEVASRDEKIIQAMGPFIIPMMADLESIIMRMFHMRMRATAFEPMPEIFDKDTVIEVEFNGILAKAHKKLTANNVMMFYAETLQTIGAVAPEEVKGGLDHGEAMRVMGDARALPPGIVLSRDQMEKRAAETAQQAQQQQLMENAPGLARAARDVAMAQKESEGQNAGGIALAP